jgi:hypothetical protein
VIASEDEAFLDAIAEFLVSVAVAARH